MKLLSCTGLGVGCALMASAQIHTEVIEYKHGETPLEGYLAYDSSTKGKRPGVLIVHQWKGLTDYEKKRAEMLAKLGYVAFAVDIYGKGIRLTEAKDAAAEAGRYKNNRVLLRARARLGLAELQKQELADPKRIAA